LKNWKNYVLSEFFGGVWEISKRSFLNGVLIDEISMTEIEEKLEVFRGWTIN